MDDLSLTEIFDDVADVGIVAEAENVIVGDARLLLCRQILVQVCDDVALDADIFHIKGNACGGDGINARGMIHKIGGKGSSLNVLYLEIAGELVNDRRYHFEVCKLLGAYLTFKIVYDIIRVTT